MTSSTRHRSTIHGLVRAVEDAAATSPTRPPVLPWNADLAATFGTLEAHADDPALRTARRSLFASVAVAAGLSTFDDPASVSVTTGERLLASVAAAGRGRRPTRIARILRRLWDGGPAPDPYPWAA